MIASTLEPQFTAGCLQVNIYWDSNLDVSWEGLFAISQLLQDTSLADRLRVSIYLTSLCYTIQRHMTCNGWSGVASFNSGLVAESEPCQLNLLIVVNSSIIHI